jgi:hypothetical protein
VTAARKRLLVPQAHPKPLRRERLSLERAAREREILARAELRHDVLVRAGFKCEACRADLRAGAVFDHWLGGNGRRKQAESRETTWALCLPCNERRTTNEPSAAAWNDIFEAHCMRHRYPFTPHITKFQKLAQYAARPPAPERDGG